MQRLRVRRVGYGKGGSCPRSPCGFVGVWRSAVELRSMPTHQNRCMGHPVHGGRKSVEGDEEEAGGEDGYVGDVEGGLGGGEE